MFKTKMENNDASGKRFRVLSEMTWLQNSIHNKSRIRDKANGYYSLKYLLSILKNVSALVIF